MAKPRPDPNPVIDEYQREHAQDPWPDNRRVLEVKLPHLAEPTEAFMIVQQERVIDLNHPWENPSCRSSGGKVYRLDFSGREIQQMCQYFNRCVERGGSVLLVRQAVLLAELIRVRAKQAGY